MRILAVAILILCAACARYEMVPDLNTPECRRKPLSSRMRLIRADSSAPPGVLQGRLIADPSGQPPQIAAVSIVGSPRGLGAGVDSGGRFRVRGIAPGRHLVLARAVGFASAADSVTVPLPRSTELEIVLIPQVIDGPCSGLVVVQARKPWWRFW
jgi:hypothetical protein